VNPSPSIFHHNRRTQDTITKMNCMDNTKSKHHKSSTSRSQLSSQYSATSQETHKLPDSSYHNQFQHLAQSLPANSTLVTLKTMLCMGKTNYYYYKSLIFKIPNFLFMQCNQLHCHKLPTSCPAPCPSADSNG